MKRFVILGSVLTLLAGLYIASPFLTAWRIREAVKSADTAYLADTIAWSQVRDSLKTSIRQNAIIARDVTAHGKSVPPSLWQRVKLAFGQPMVDSFVERYVTPEGLPQLFRLKSSYVETVHGEADEATLGVSQRLMRFMRRIKRAEFQTPTRVEIEMADKRSPGRHYVSRMELVGFSWKLTWLEVKVVGAAGPPLPSLELEPVFDRPQRLLESRIGSGPRLP